MKKTSKSKGKKRHSKVIQEHHISYVPEVVVKVFKGEHYILNMLLRRQRVSKGFITALKKWLTEWENKGEELTEH